MGSLAVAALQQAAGHSQTKTKTKKRVKALTDAPKGKRRRVKKRTVKSFIPKVKKTKFSKAVKKVIDSTDAIGQSTVIVYAQLRQTSLDRYNYVTSDSNSFLFSAGNWLDILNHASMLFNSKGLTSDVSVEALNLDSHCNASVTSYTGNMFFKSTSNHVVNIDIFECTAKKDGNDGPYEDWVDSYGSVIERFLDGKSSGPYADIYGVRPNIHPEMLKNWTIKVHSIKLQPGDHASKSFLICKGKDFVGAALKNENAHYTYTKGSKAFFFRVINDPTVSATTGDIHQWPSTNQGGVALRFSRTLKMPPPDVVPVANQKPSAVVVNSTKVVGTSTDQQVVFQNPLAAATPL